MTARRGPSFAPGPPRRRQRRRHAEANDHAAHCPQPRIRDAGFGCPTRLVGRGVQDRTGQAEGVMLQLRHALVNEPARVVRQVHGAARRSPATTGGTAAWASIYSVAQPPCSSRARSPVRSPAAARLTIACSLLVSGLATMLARLCQRLSTSSTRATSRSSLARAKASRSSASKPGRSCGAYLFSAALMPGPDRSTSVAVAVDTRRVSRVPRPASRVASPAAMPVEHPRAKAQCGLRRCAAYDQDRSGSTSSNRVTPHHRSVEP